MQGREDIDDATLDRVLDAFQDEDVSPALTSLVTRTIASLRAPPDISTMAAKEFKLDEAILAFSLKFTSRDCQTWYIEDIPGTKDFVVSSCLGKYFKHSYSTTDPYLNGMVGIDTLMANHSKNSGRGREAVCRTKLDIILNECLM